MCDKGREYHVMALHPNANDTNVGTLDLPFKTISQAAKVLQSGDSVWVHEGVYRERIAPKRGGLPDQVIRYLSVPGERVVVKGSNVWEPEWQKVFPHGFVWKGQLDMSVFHDFNPFAIQARGLPGRKTLGQVFVDGNMFMEVDSDDDLHTTPGTWKVVDEATAILVHFPSSTTEIHQSLVEISVRDRIFAPHVRGLGYIHIEGFVFEHCANQFPYTFWDPNGFPQAGAVGCRSGHHWTILNNTIRFAKSIGLDCGSEGGRDIEGNQPIPENAGHHVIRNNVISDNGACGIAGWKHSGTRIIGNMVERNNSLGWTSAEKAGIKFHYFIDGLIEGNLVRDNDAHGIWLDNVWYGSRVTRNVCINNTGGIFVELGSGPCLVDNNIVAFTRTGDGIYTHDASGVTIAHNFLYCNTHFGVFMRVVSDRPVETVDGKGEIAETSHQKVINNVFVDNYRGHICMPLPSERSMGNESDYNLFINGAQWHWEGLGFHRFVVNTNGGRIPIEQLIESLDTVLEEHEVPRDKRPNFTLWTHQPYVTSQWWQMLMEHDQHSSFSLVEEGEIENGAVQKGSFNFSARGTHIQFAQGLLFHQLRCPPVVGVDNDFYGHEMVTDGHVYPGPFQKITPGFNLFHLWRVPEPISEERVDSR